MKIKFSPCKLVMTAKKKKTGNSEVIGNLLIRIFDSHKILPTEIFGFTKIKTKQEATKSAVDVLPEETQKKPIMNTKATFLEYEWVRKFAIFGNMLL